MNTTIDAATIAIVRDVVDGLVRNRKLFTAWEIAVIAHKHRGAEVARSVMKEEVHNYYNAGNSEFSDSYNRTLRPVTGGKKAYVFHHVEDDPTTYQPLDRVAADPDVRVDLTTPANIDIPIADEEDEDEDEENYNPDKLGRLRIPSKVLKEYGLQAGDMVNLGVDSLAQVTVISKNGGDFNPISGVFSKVFRYKVDQYNNVRIGKTRLPKCQSEFKIIRDANHNQLNVSTKD